jgi:hypothetical protein
MNRIDITKNMQVIEEVNRGSSQFSGIIFSVEQTRQSGYLYLADF